MISIYYPTMVVGITILWFLTRTGCILKSGVFRWKRELQLLLVYICIVVVARFTFFPFSKVNGQIQPLVFDPAQAFPFRVNFIPFVYLMDYPEFRNAMLNLIGNTAMFIPLGIVWPSVFPELNTHRRVIAAGVGCSLLIEILQLPFFDRVSDIDDLILNSTGYLIGYGVYLLVRRLCKK